VTEIYLHQYKSYRSQQRDRIQGEVSTKSYSKGAEKSTP